MGREDLDKTKNYIQERNQHNNMQYWIQVCAEICDYLFNKKVINIGYGRETVYEFNSRDTTICLLNMKELLLRSQIPEETIVKAIIVVIVIPLLIQKKTVRAFI